MTKEVRWRGGTTAENDAFTGAPKEVVVDTTKNTLRVHDGVTQGGHEIASVEGDNQFSGDNTFTGNNTFTDNNSFTGNNEFSGDNTFTGNNTLSGDNQFIGSNEFTGDNVFSGNNALTGDNQFTGTNTFTEDIVGSITGNAATVTNGVYTVGDQEIGGNKTFSNPISIKASDGFTTTLSVEASGEDTSETIITDISLLDRIATEEETIAGVVDNKFVTPKTLAAVTETLRNSSDSQGAYGLTWDSTNDTYVSVGSSNRTAIQSKMKRCVLNADGTVNYYLHPENSNYKEDGTPAVLDGTDGNVMVQVPLFWYKHTLNGDIHEWWVSDKPLDGFSIHPWFLEGGVEHPFRYYRAYTCVNQDGVLRSVSGVKPTVNQRIGAFRTQARANGAGWGLCSLNAVNAIQILYLTEYCTFNSQSVLGYGYGNGSGDRLTTGQSNVIGNTSSGPSNNDVWMSYRGIENFYGDCWEFIDGINLTWERKVYLNQNPDTFADDVFSGDYVYSGIILPQSEGLFVKNVSGNFLPIELGGDSNTFITDVLFSFDEKASAQFGGPTGDEEFFRPGSGAFCWNTYVDSQYYGEIDGAGLSR